MFIGVCFVNQVACKSRYPQNFKAKGRFISLNVNGLKLDLLQMHHKKLVITDKNNFLGNFLCYFTYSVFWACSKLLSSKLKNLTLTFPH